jgi:hypothetical protein
VAQLTQVSTSREHYRLYRACISLLEEMETVEAYFLAKRLTMRLSCDHRDVPRNQQIGMRKWERDELKGTMCNFIRNFEKAYCE